MRSQKIAGLTASEYYHLCALITKPNGASEALNEYITIMSKKTRGRKQPSARAFPIQQEDRNLFESSLSCRIPISEYNEYHAYILNVLKAYTGFIQKSISKDDANDWSKLRNREGSTRFEKVFLKPKIKDTKGDFIKEFEKLNKSGRYRIVDVFDFEDINAANDADSRLFSDLVLKVEDRKNNFSYVPVNVKATKGFTSDNIGGWAALQFSLLGYTQNQSSRSKALFQVSKNDVKQNHSASDYFLWSFIKDQSGALPFVNAHAFSLLEFSPNNYQQNTVQSFPIQGNVEALILAQNREPIDILKRRVEWLNGLKNLYTLKAFETIFQTMKDIK